MGLAEPEPEPEPAFAGAPGPGGGIAPVWLHPGKNNPDMAASGRAQGPGPGPGPGTRGPGPSARDQGPGPGTRGPALEDVGKIFYTRFTHPCIPLGKNARVGKITDFTRVLPALAYLSTKMRGWVKRE